MIYPIGTRSFAIESLQILVFRDIREFDLGRYDRALHLMMIWDRKRWPHTRLGEEEVLATPSPPGIENPFEALKGLDVLRAAGKWEVGQPHLAPCGLGRDGHLHFLCAVRVGGGS